MNLLAGTWIVWVVLWQCYSRNNAYHHSGGVSSKGQRYHHASHEAGSTTENPLLRDPSSVISTRKPDLHHRQHQPERDENPKGYPQKRYYEQWLKHGAVGNKQFQTPSPSLSYPNPKIHQHKDKPSPTAAASKAVNGDDLADAYQQQQYLMDGSAPYSGGSTETSSVGANNNNNGAVTPVANNGDTEEASLPHHQDNINQTQHNNAEPVHHNKGKKATHSGRSHARPVAGVHGVHAINPFERHRASGTAGGPGDSLNVEPGGASPSRSHKSQVSFDTASHETHRVQFELTDDNDRVRQYLFEQLVKGSRGSKRPDKRHHDGKDDADEALMLQQDPFSVGSTGGAGAITEADSAAPAAATETANNNESMKSSSSESQFLNAFRSPPDLALPSATFIGATDTKSSTHVALTPTSSHKTEQHKSRRHKSASAGNKRIPRAKQGRHVCTHEERVTKPVRVVESYCKPAYKSFSQRCANGTTCTAFRVQYDTIYRTVIKYQTSTEKRQSCCPGWTTSAKHAHGCLQPLCALGCKHGGTCIKPDLCQCPLGYTGPTCETDVDECAGDHKCQQVCINTFGSYTCNCHDGFELQKDGRTCKFRIESVPELMAILAKLEQLEKNQQEALAIAPSLPSVSSSQAPPVVEFDSTLIESKLNRLEAQLNELSDRMDKLELDKANVANLNRDDNPLSLTSLSDQIGILEEKLGECTCTPAKH